VLAHQSARPKSMLRQFPDRQIAWLPQIAWSGCTSHSGQSRQDNAARLRKGYWCALAPFCRSQKKRLSLISRRQFCLLRRSGESHPVTSCVSDYLATLVLGLVRARKLELVEIGRLNAGHIFARETRG